MIFYVFVWFSYSFGVFLVDFNRRPLPDLWLSYDFLWFYSFPMVFLCFQLILIVAPRPINGYLMVSYSFLMAFLLCSYGFAMFPVDFSRRASPDLRLSYDFLWFSYDFPWFCYVSG